ncbi:purple acid phosphatase family protein [Tsukamurella soli]|uniref:purple acid phosphatase family protein n=1 Tax=Tsukamurella soli TaxID=644556 RepID=UPI00360B415F
MADESSPESARPQPTGAQPAASVALARRGVSRRRLLGAGVAGLAVGAGGTALATTHTGAGATAGGGGALWPAADLVAKPGVTGAPVVAGLHLQFGADTAREVVVTWHTDGSVTRPRVRYGTAAGGFGASVDAETRAYTDGKSGREVQVHHARITGLRPDTDYVYAAGHDGAQPETGTIRTAPSGRAAFRFTSFGDQGTPTVGKLDGTGAYVNDNLGSPFAGDVTAAVERMSPLLNLVNGDLCYANLADDRIRTWNDYWVNNSRSARFRPWMPAPGNHENEKGNGQIGYAAFQTYFTVPDSGAESLARGLWYSFTVGAVRFIALADDDICIQDGGDSYVRGYSGGAQKRWLEGELAKARGDKSVDWVIVFMHQTAISSAKGNGADLGIRQEWLPLFDRYQVDLVLAGHEHHYERSHPVRGTLPTDVLTPDPVSTRDDVVDTSKGTVHMVIGGGGTSAPSNKLFFPGAQCRVLTAVGAPDPANRGRKTQTYVMEQAVWSAFKDPANAYGFCSFDVDPGSPGGHTTIKGSYHAVVGAGTKVVDSFTLTRPRSDRE